MSHPDPALDLVPVYCGESGAHLFDAPRLALEGCCPTGIDASPMVRSWLSRCRNWCTHAELVAHLRRFGAWDDLATATTETLRKRALWNASGTYLDFDEREEVFA